MTIIVLAFAAVIFIVHALSMLDTRKALIDMSIALDALTAQVATLETQAAAAVTEIARLQAAGENAPALDALTSRIKAAGDILATATAPKV